MHYIAPGQGERSREGQGPADGWVVLFQVKCPSDESRGVSPRAGGPPPVRATCLCIDPTKTLPLARQPAATRRGSDKAGVPATTTPHHPREPSPGLEYKATLSRARGVPRWERDPLWFSSARRLTYGPPHTRAHHAHTPTVPRRRRPPRRVHARL